MQKTSFLVVSCGALILVVAASGPAPAIAQEASIPEHLAAIELQWRVVALDRDGRDPFIYISDARRAPNGTTYVIDGGALRIAQISRDGEVLEAWGRQGDGPQEFQGLTGILLAEDSVVAVYDLGRRGVARLRPDSGELEWHFFLDAPRGSTFAALTPQGIVVHYRDSPVSSRLTRGGTIELKPEPLHGQPFRIQWTTLDRSATATTGPYPGVSRFLAVHEDGRGMGMADAPFGPVIHVYGRRGRVMVAHSSSPTIELYAADGELLRRVTLPLRTRSIDEIGHDPQVPERVLSWAWTQAFEMMELPETLPYFDRIVLAEDGESLFVHEYSTHTSGIGDWLEFSLDGEVLSSITLDVPVWDVLDLSHDWVLVKEYDDFDVQSLVLYGLGSQR